MCLIPVSAHGKCVLSLSILLSPFHYLAWSKNLFSSLFIFYFACLGTNPASASMCGMKVVVVASDESGNIDLEDLRAKALKHKDNLVRQ